MMHGGWRYCTRCGRLTIRYTDKSCQVCGTPSPRTWPATGANEDPAITQQAKPDGTGPEITPLVIADFEARAAMGRAKYGEALRAFNGRNAMIDLLQELMDATLYLRQKIEEDRLMAMERLPVIGWDISKPGQDRAVMVYGYVKAGVLHITRIDDITPEAPKEGSP